jgi:hypothetical protein
LRDGVGGFITGVTIETGARRFVTNLQRIYSVQPNTTNGNLADIYLAKAKIRTVPNPGGNLVPPDVARTRVELAPGNYRLIVEITVTTKAEQQADLEAAAAVSIR